jgi:hypothetical protein
VILGRIQRWVLDAELLAVNTDIDGAVEVRCRGQEQTSENEAVAFGKRKCGLGMRTQRIL